MHAAGDHHRPVRRHRARSARRRSRSASWRGDKYGHRTRSRCAARSLPAKRQPRKLRPLAARRRFCPRRSAPPAPKAHQPMAGPRVERGAERSEHRAGVVVTRLSGTHARAPLPAGSRIGQAQWRRSLPKPAGQRDEQPRGGERRCASGGSARPESAVARTRRRMDRRACASLYPGEFHRRVIYCWRATTHAVSASQRTSSAIGADPAVSFGLVLRPGARQRKRAAAAMLSTAADSRCFSLA